MTWNGEGLVQGCSAKQLASYCCTRLASIPATHGKCLIGTTSLCAAHLPLPSVEEQHSHTDGVSVTRTSSFSQDTSGVFAEIKIRTVKGNICEANEKWNTELSRAASVGVVVLGFRRDKNPGEGWGGGEWKAPNPEAYEKQEPAGWEGQRRIGLDIEITSRLPAGIPVSTLFLLVGLFSKFPATSSALAFSTVSLPPTTVFSNLPAKVFNFPFLFASCFFLSSCVALGSILASSPAIFSPFSLPPPTQAAQECFVFLMIQTDLGAFGPTGNSIRRKHEKQLYVK